MDSTKQPKYIIGIDPGVETGIAVYDKSYHPPKLIVLQTTEFWECYSYIIENYTIENCAIYCEDPSQNAPTFDHNISTVTVLERKKRERMSQNVGSNKREATLLIEGLQRKGFRVYPVKPTGRKGVKRKWNHKQLVAMTKWEQTTSSQHARDAAMIAIGR